MLQLTGLLRTKCSNIQYTVGSGTKEVMNVTLTERIRARHRSGRARTGSHRGASSSPLGIWRDPRADGPRQGPRQVPPRQK